VTNSSQSKKILPLTIVNYVTGILGIILGALLSIPLLLGAIKIIFQDGTIPSAESSIGVSNHFRSFRRCRALVY